MIRGRKVLGEKYPAVGIMTVVNSRNKNQGTEVTQKSINQPILLRTEGLMKNVIQNFACYYYF